MKVNDRLIWLDIAKGLVIILMVLGHSSIPKFISNWIWAFHMPFFFLSSGFTTNWKNYGCLEFVKKKINSIVRPFVLYSLMVILILAIFNIDHPYCNFTNGWGGYALWFVPVLFVALILAKFFFMMEPIYRNVYFLLLPSISYLFCYFDFSLPWNMSVVPFASMFIIFGGLVKPYVKNVDYNRWSEWLIISLTFVSSAIISYFCRLDMCYNNVIPMVPMVMGALCGSVCICFISIKIYKYNRFFSNILQVIGRETYTILAFSQVIIQVINKCFNLNAIVKYLFLIIILIVCVCVKKQLIFLKNSLTKKTN